MRRGLYRAKNLLAKVVEQMKAYGGIAGVAQILTTSDGRTMEWATADGTDEVGVLLGENEEAGEEDTEFGMDSTGALKLTSKSSACPTSCCRIARLIWKPTLVAGSPSVSAAVRRVI